MGGGGGLFISNMFEEGLLEKGGGDLFNLEKMVVSALHNKLERKLKKLKYKKLEVMQPTIKNKSELPINHRGSVQIQFYSNY